MTSWIAAGALVFFVASACVFIPQFGIEGDEPDFAAPFYRSGFAGSLNLLGKQLPTMFNSYLGTEKTYVYAPVLKALPPTLWSLRLPIVLIGALSLWLLFTATRRLTNCMVAAALIWLLATDPIFMLTTTFDWGPVALQHLCMIAAFACLSRSKPMVFTAFLAIGLAWWDKSTASWITGGMFVSAILFLAGPVRAHVSVRNAIKALGGFAIGALPLLLFNIQNHWATFRDNAKLSTAHLPDKIWAMWATLNGWGMFNWLVRGGTPSWYSLVPLCVLAALVLLFSRRVAPVRPIALFALSTGLLTWMAMFFTMNAGGAVHHTILVWPWPHLFAACVLGYALRPKPFAVVMVATVLANIVTVGFYEQRSYRFGPTSGWSDATSGLPGLLDTIPANRRIVVIDWGIDNPLIYLTRGKVFFGDITFSGLTDAEIPDLGRTEFLAHVPGEEMFAGNDAKFDAAIGKLGFVRVPDHIVEDSRGHPFFMSFHCIRRVPAGS